MAATRNSTLQRYERQMRGEAVTSLDDLRKKLEISPMKMPDRRSKLLNSSSVQSSPYSASVEKLKELIEKYKKGGRRPNEIIKIVRDRFCSVKERRYDPVFDTDSFGFSMYESRARDSFSCIKISATTEEAGFATPSVSQLELPEPDELVPLLNDQHTLLQHLEDQVSYYKDSLSMLKQKAEIVIEENNRLHGQLIDGIQGDFSDLHGSYNPGESPSKLSLIDCAVQTNTNEFLESTGRTSEKNIVHGQSQLTIESQHEDNAQILSEGQKEDANVSKDSPVGAAPLNFVKIHDSSEEIRRLTEVHTQKTKNLETLLEVARIEINEKERQMQILQRRQSTLAASVDKDDGSLCIKCAHSEAILGTRKFGINEKVVRRMERENNELLETASKQRKIIEELRRKEMDAYIQVKKSCELAEQAQLEKQEVTINMQQLKSVVNRLKEENKKQIMKSNESIQKEKMKIKSEFEEKIGKLREQVDESNEKLSRTEIHLERVNREKLDIKSSLSKLEANTAIHDEEMQKKLNELGNSVLEASKTSAMLKQENQTLQYEKRNLESIQDQRNEWSVAEMNSLKQRLLETGEKLEVAKGESVGVIEELQEVKKQLLLEKSARNQEKSLFNEKMEQLTILKNQTEEQSQQIQKKLEGKCESIKLELSSLLESQMQISKSFKDEYKRLLEKHEEMEAANKLTCGKLLDEKDQYKKDLAKTLNEKRSLSLQVENLREEMQKSQKSFKAAEAQGQMYAEKAINLLNKYNSVLRERHLLREEIEFLKSQIPGFRTSDRISISDLDSIEKATG